jgi:NodT family efflux transporter outer membrane factor (OMF) lipoprotein
VIAGRHIACVALLSSLAACTVGPDFVRPEGPATRDYNPGGDTAATRQAGGKAQRFDSGYEVPEAWWRLFHATKLDPIVRDALAKNQTLEQAQATLRAAQDSLRAGKGAYYPQLNANASVSRERQNPAAFGVPIPPNEFSLFTLSGAVTYVLDIWGSTRRAVEELDAEVDLNRYTVLATYLTLTGNIVNTLLARSAYEAEIHATEEIISAERGEIALTGATVKAGTTAYSALLSLQSQLAATQATLPPLALRLDQADHLLAVLSGVPPSEWKSPGLALADFLLPERLPKVLPADLVRRRPDILVAEARLHSASAAIGVATAALYPTLSLTGTIGLENVHSGDLFSSQKSSFWNIGAGLAAPLFHGGTLRAQKDAAVDTFQATAASYRETVLEGVQQVADTLRALEHDAELVEAESASLAAANESLELTRANFRAGTTGYLSVLTANAQALQARLGLLQATAQRLQDTVALFLALGGGWGK